MYRNVTAVYRTYAVADLVRRELHELGIATGHVRVVPDSDTTAVAGDRDSRHVEALHDLHLPEDDVRTYQDCVRRGDYVVSAEVDEDQVARVQQIMRRPEEEARNLDTRAGELGDEPLAPRPADRPLDESRIGTRDETTTDPYSRTYRRDKRLDPYD